MESEALSWYPSEAPFHLSAFKTTERIIVENEALSWYPSEAYFGYLSEA